MNMTSKSISNSAKPPGPIMTFLPAPEKNTRPSTYQNRADHKCKWLGLCAWIVAGRKIGNWNKRAGGFRLAGVGSRTAERRSDGRLSTPAILALTFGRHGGAANGM